MRNSIQFDLDAALQGEPIRLKNGMKAFIHNDLSRTGHKVLTEFPLRGYIVLSRGIEHIAGPLVVDTFLIKKMSMTLQVCGLTTQKMS